MVTHPLPFLMVRAKRWMVRVTLQREVENDPCPSVGGVVECGDAKTGVSLADQSPVVHPADRLCKPRTFAHCAVKSAVPVTVTPDRSVRGASDAQAT